MSSKALRELNAHWALPNYSVFEDEKSNGSDEKWVGPKWVGQAKNRIKTDRTNIIATNFV